MTEPTPLQDRIRAAVAKLRTTSMPLADLIPLLQETADALDRAEQDECDSDETIIRLGELLRGVVDALKGPPEPGTGHSTHDAPVYAEAAVALIAHLLVLYEGRSTAEEARKRAVAAVADYAGSLAKGTGRG